MSFTILHSAAVIGAGSGVLFGTDLTYAPIDPNGNRAWIRIWGVNLPASPTVRVNGKSQTVVESTDDTNLPLHYGLLHDGLISSINGYYKRVTIHLDNVVSGDTTITLDGVSGSLPFTVGSTGRIMFCGPGGSDSADGRTEATRFLTLAPFVGVTSGKRAGAGDILYPMNATYSGQSGSPNGFGGCAVEFYNCRDIGTAAAPIAISGYPTHLPRLTGVTGAQVAVRGSSADHWRFCNFEVDNFTGAGGQSTVIQIDSNDVRVVGVYAHDTSQGYGTIDIPYISNGAYVAFCKTYNCQSPGNKLAHDLYLGIAEGNCNNILAEHNNLTFGRGGRGIQCFGHFDYDYYTSLVLRYNRIVGMRYNGLLVGGSDVSATVNMVPYPGADVYANDVSDCGHDADVGERAQIRIQGQMMAGVKRGTWANVRKNVLHAGAGGTDESLWWDAPEVVNYGGNVLSGSIISAGSVLTVNNEGGNVAFPGGL